MEDFREKVRAELEENILPFWSGRMADPRGGFLGRMDGKGMIVEDSPKGGVLCARILWTFASAYRITGKAEYLETAIIARDEMIDDFYDEAFGGTFWSLDGDNKPLDTKKQIYAIAFAIYGLSEFYRACGDELSLEYAIKLFHSIEDHSFDSARNGYLEAFGRDWSPLKDMRLSDKDQNDAKTMNTHLHILEGYTALYRVWKDESLARQLKNLIEIFLDRIILSDGHLALFFNEEWNITSHCVSYGHDIECSWLLEEAAEVLGDENLLKRVSEACSRIAVAAMEGWSNEGGMIYEKDIISGLADGDRHWWVQAETVLGCLWQHRRSGEEIWLSRAADELDFIFKEIVCPDGEWYWSRKKDGSANTEDDRAGFWKCPYHNGRMCMEILENF